MTWGRLEKSPIAEKAITVDKLLGVAVLSLFWWGDKRAGASDFYGEGCHTLAFASFRVIWSDIYLHKRNNFKFTHFALWLAMWQNMINTEVYAETQGQELITGIFQSIQWKGKEVTLRGKMCAKSRKQLDNIYEKSYKMTLCQLSWLQTSILTCTILKSL